MILTLDKLKKAREAGYTDDEISSFSSEQNSKIGEAIKAGYSLDEIADFYTTSPQAQALSEQDQLQSLRQVPEAINRAGGLPVGGEPMVGGPDVLAMEPGQTKTFMEGEPVKIESEKIGRAHV